MISKERLEELIKEGATTYWLVGKMVLNIHLDSSYYVSDANILCHKRSEDEKNCVEHIEYLFETKEQAEWALKYHATRTEELDLPMWEEWCENILNDCETIIFSDTHYNKYGMFVDGRLDENIIITKYLSGKYIVFKPNSQENYIKACDLCLKLFNGEE